jgi:hypothetical protein
MRDQLAEVPVKRPKHRDKGPPLRNWSLPHLTTRAGP